MVHEFAEIVNAWHINVCYCSFSAHKCFKNYCRLEAWWKMRSKASWRLQDFPTPFWDFPARSPSPSDTCRHSSSALLCKNVTWTLQHLLQLFCHASDIFQCLSETFLDNFAWPSGHLARTVLGPCPAFQTDFLRRSKASPTLSQPFHNFPKPYWNSRQHFQHISRTFHNLPATLSGAFLKAFRAFKTFWKYLERFQHLSYILLDPLQKDPFQNAPKSFSKPFYNLSAAFLTPRLSLLNLSKPGKSNKELRNKRVPWPPLKQLFLRYSNF